MYQNMFKGTSHLLHFSNNPWPLFKGSNQVNAVASYIAMFVNFK